MVPVSRDVHGRRPLSDTSCEVWEESRTVTLPLSLLWAESKLPVLQNLLTVQNKLWQNMPLVKTSLSIWKHCKYHEWTRKDLITNVGRFHPVIGQDWPLGRVEVQLYSIFDLGTRRGWGVSVTPRPHLNPGKDLIPIVQEAGWASGPVWTGAENLAPTGIRSPDRPARRQSLYRLRYPAH